MKRIACVLIVALVLMSACAKDEEKKAVCRVSQNGISDEMTLNALNDEVLNSKSIMTVPFSLYELTTEEERAQFTEQMMAGFSEVEGIKVSSETTEEEFVLTIEVDYTVAALESLLELGLIEESDMDSEMISYEMTVENLVSMGYTCE